MRSFSSRSGRWLPLALALAPPLALFWLIASHGVDVPRWDDWSLVPVLRCDNDTCLAWSAIGRQHVESRPVTSRLLVLALAPFVGFDVRSLMFASLACVSVSSLLLLRMARASLLGSPRARLWLWAAANAAVFSIAQAKTWLHGAQVGAYLVIVTLIGGLALVSSGAPLAARILGGIAIATLSTFSMTSGLIAWLLFPVVSLLRTSRRWLWGRLGLWGFACAAALTLYFWGFEDRSPGSWAALQEPHRALGYALAFLGAPFGRALGEEGRAVLLASAGFGALLAGLAAACVAALFRAREPDRWRRASPWLALALFACATAGMAALGRLAYGMEQALSPRYMAWSIYLPVALLFLVPVAFEGRRRVLRIAAVLAAPLLCLHLVTSWQMLRRADADRHKHLALRAALDFALVAPEPRALEQLFPWPQRLLERAAFLNERALLRRPLASSDRVLQIAASRQPVPEAGAIERYRVTSDELVVRGWAVLPRRAEPAHAVLLCAEAPGQEPGGPRVIAVVGGDAFRAKAATTAPDGADRSSTWKRRVDLSRLHENESRVTAWAYDAISGRAMRLHGEIQIDSSR